MLDDRIVRVRYAPSPTGLQHIGSVRTALFNYLFARSSGGRFILRIEDTDNIRSEERYIQDLYQSLEWLGIQPDEGPIEAGFKGGDFGPYMQSQRIELYQKYARQLLDEGKAYYCFCSSQRLEQLREQQQQTKSSWQGYDRHCRNLDPAEATARFNQGQPCVLRFAIPLELTARGAAPVTVFTDLSLGQIERANSDINIDPIILKADGFPTYHFANVIDDHLMQISHVLRAQEWLSSSPLHILLYQAFGWEPPKFCHLPMVMGNNGAKLSKRHGSTSLIEFRKAGYLSHAIINYVALLGWAFDDSREFFNLAELEQCFDLSKLSRSPATFDYQKLEWFNGQYIRKLEVHKLQQLLHKQNIWAGTSFTKPQNFEQSLEWILPLLQERLKFLNDAPNLAAYFFSQPEYFKPILAVPKKHNIEETLALLQKGRIVLQQLCAQNGSKDWHNFASLLKVKQNWEAAFRAAAADAKLKMGPLMQPIRYAITGNIAAPPLLESMLIIERLAGAEELFTRLDTLAQLLSNLQSQLDKD